MVSITASKSASVSETGQSTLECTKHGLLRAFIASMAFNLATTLAPPLAMAESPDVSASQEAADGQDKAPDSTQENNGSDLTRPQTALEVRPSDRSSSNDTSKTNKAELLVRVSSKIPLEIDWRLGVLAQIPLIEKTTTNFEPENVNRELGIGDAVFQAFVAHDVNERWAFGIGARVSAQTGADSLGSGEWQVMPGLGVRCSLPEWGADSYFVPTMRWALSIPGNPEARRISEPQIAPTLSIDLPGPFFVTLYPSNDIRINYGAR
jgi:Putative MetA-pathway of phenol degradation